MTDFVRRAVVRREPPRKPFATLGNRLKYLRLQGIGKSDKEIAAAMNLNENQLKTLRA